MQGSDGKETGFTVTLTDFVLVPPSFEQEIEYVLVPIVVGTIGGTLICVPFVANFQPAHIPAPTEVVLAVQKSALFPTI
ncbi:MAG TPA: hypothetical protein DCS08_03765 [Candidatus Moranbacteria bacterium]|nr:hypothetical protein [Candidatus Moranbacteria bacterium]